MVTDLNSLRSWVSLGLARSLVAGMTIAGLSLGIAATSPTTAFVLGAMAVAFVAAGLALTPTLRGRIRESRKRRGRLANNLGEKVLASRTVALLARSRAERRRIRSQSRRLAEALVHRARFGSLLRALPELALSVAIASLALLARADATHASDLVVGVLLVGLVTASLRDLARAWDQRLAFEEGRRRIETLLAAPRLRSVGRSEGLPGTGALALAFDGVSMKGLFRDLCAELAPGDRVVVVGPSGCGKSTLLALAARMLDPDEGEVRLGGRPIGSLPIETVRAAVQLVSPEVPLLRGTVGSNVLYGASAAATAEPDSAWIDAVLEACRLREPSGGLAKGLDTSVAEQGRNLPSGLRARIALARALAIRPRLVLIDDPAFIVDPLAAAALSQLSRRSDATWLCVGSERTRDVLEAALLDLGAGTDDANVPAPRAPKPRVRSADVPQTGPQALEDVPRAVDARRPDRVHARIEIERLGKA
jgi:ABC-type multidrug transport system fused ATPase/permease subunit